MTHRYVTSIAAIAAVLVPLSISGLAAAQAAKKPAAPGKVVVAVVDAQLIFNRSEAMKHVREQMETERKKFQTVIAAEEKRLRADGEKLRRQRSVLAPQAFQRRRQKLQADIANVQRRIQAKQRQISAAYGKTTRQFRKALVEVVTEIAKERGFTLVLSQQQVVYSQSSMIITEEALTRVNKRLPLLKLELPEGPRTPTVKRKPAKAGGTGPRRAKPKN